MSTPASMAPRWARWVIRRLLGPDDARVVATELDELRETLLKRMDRAEADRLVRREWRRHAWGALWSRVAAGASLARAGAVGARDSGEPGRRRAWTAGPDLAQSARSLARAPGLTSAVVLSVGLGIGGCTTIFALVDALWLRPLPYPDADRLVRIYTDSPPFRFAFSVVDFQALAGQQTSFEGVAAFARRSRTLLTPAGADVVPTVEPTPGLLELLGIRLQEGRAPGPDEGRPDAPPTVLVTSGFAERHLGAPDGSGVVGRAITLDGVPHEVVGVLAGSLAPLARGVEVFPTLRLQPPSRKGPFFLVVFARLRPPVEPGAARSELRALNARLFPLWADSYQGRSDTWGMIGLEEFLRGDAGTLLAVLMGAVGMVFLVALANAANLLTARVSARGRELAVREALGASHARIRGHLLTESGLLAAGGAVVGLAAARAGTALLPVVASSWLPRTTDAFLSWRVIVFALALAAASTLVFAVIPSLHRRGHGGLAATLRAGGRGATASRGTQRTQRLLVGGQVAAVVPLLAGAFLLLDSFRRLESVDPGFDAEHLLSMRVSLPTGSYRGSAERTAFWDATLDRVGAIPGVEGVALTTETPPDDLGNLNNFDLEDRPTPPGEPQPLAAWLVASAGLFHTLGVPLLEGRGFQPEDLDDDAPPVVLVDEAWQRANFPGGSAVGRRLHSGGQTEGPRTTVIGVVGSVPYEGVGTSQRGAVYAPGAQTLQGGYLMVRTRGEPTALVSAIRGQLRALDATVPVTEIATGGSLLDEALVRPRHLTVLSAAFSTLAAILAVVGIYGITAYSVQQRRADVAVRLALGGAPRTVLAAALLEGLRVSLAGLAAGTGAAFFVTAGLSGLLYGVEPRDPRALGGALGLLLVVSVAATLVPALRVTRVDPASTLREE